MLHKLKMYTIFIQQLIKLQYCGPLLMMANAKRWSRNFYSKKKSALSSTVSALISSETALYSFDFIEIRRTIFRFFLKCFELRRDTSIPRHGVLFWDHDVERRPVRSLPCNNMQGHAIPIFPMRGTSTCSESVQIFCGALRVWNGGLRVL